MSLIQDALKRKREEEVSAPPQEAPAAPPVIEPKPAGKLKPTPDKLLIALILLIIVSLISIGIIKFNRAPTTESKAASKATPQQPAKTAEVPSVVEKAIDKITGDGWPELNLTGFAAGSGQRMVFINGKMLAEGRKIAGARIVQIGKTEVLVEYQGERRILRVDDE